jgi:hypothetical protein
VFVPGFIAGISVAVSLDASAFAELSIPNWRRAEEAATRMVDIFGHLDRIH